MNDNGQPQLPRTRREFRAWLHAHGFAKRFAEKLAVHFPESETDLEADETELAEFHRSIDRLKNSFHE